jgi:hypothetical protein
VDAHAKNLPTGDLETALLSLTPSNPYDAVAYLNASDILFGEALTTKRNEVFNYLMTNDPAFMDADFAGMALSAVFTIQDSISAQSYVSRMIQEIKNNQTNTGVSAWGSSNASSTAASMIGLYAVGEDPRSEAYTVDGVDLVEALWSYKGSVGFKYLINDSQDDLAFSTPQAFAALVMYKIYRDQHMSWTTLEFNLWRSIN